MSKVWFITGAGRGMGVDISKAALAGGNKVVATGRNTDKVAEALGKSGNLLPTVSCPLPSHTITLSRQQNASTAVILPKLGTKCPIPVI